MSILDALKIAFKNLWRRKLRTTLTIFAVSVGVTAVVSLVAIALGAQNAFIGQIESIGMLSRVTVVGMADIEEVSLFDGMNYAEDDPDATTLDDAMIEELKNINNVTAVFPDIDVWSYSNLFFEHNGEAKRASPHLTSTPVTPNPDDQVTLAAGRHFTSNSEKNVIILGNTYVEAFGFTPEEIIGQEVTLRSHEGSFGINDELPDPFTSDADDWKNHRSQVTATIIGVTTMGPAESNAYISIDWAKDLMKRKEYEWPEEEDYQAEPKEVIVDELEDRGYSTLSVYVNNSDNVEQASLDIEEKYVVSAITMEDLLAEIMNLFTIIEVVLGIIGSISLGVAAIGIVNTMVMSIYERTREIGVMKAVGASKSAIRKMFTIEASLIGLLGGAIGLGMGYALTIGANYAANYFMSQESIPLTNIIELPLYLTLGVIAFSTIIGTLAGLYPAWRAARLDPIKALHSE